MNLFSVLSSSERLIQSLLLEKERRGTPRNGTGLRNGRRPFTDDDEEADDALTPPGPMEAKA